MKSRSNGLPMPNPQDDWGDGSWTVDCLCGVNFDDGEEMVNCDDCGVWVHTRCVRYVKSEKVFSCDKCKNKNSRNDSEETEVAQLLVELPTKTLSMENPFNSSLPSQQRPFRLWTELPMEERVHVQGIPGGDPSLFAGVSSIFGPQLWKCTGYVPKKFNFRYREFPCQDAENKQVSENNETTENGAGVLFSLSMESNLPASVSNSIAIKSDAKYGKCDVSLSSKQTKRSDGSDSDGINLHTKVKKDVSSLRPVMIHSGKRKKEEFGICKDQGGKLRKKAQIVEKEGDFKKKGPHIRTASKFLNGEKEMQFYEDRGSKVVTAGAHRTSNGSLEGAAPSDHLAEGTQRLDTDCGNFRSTLNSSEHHTKMSSLDVPKQKSSSETFPQEQNENQVASKIQNSLRENDGMASSFVEHSESVSLPAKDEDAAGGREASTVSAKVELQKSESVTTAIVSDDIEVKNLRNCHDLTGDVTCSSVPETKAKADDVHRDSDTHSSSPCDATLERTRSSPHHADTSNILLNESVKVNDAPVVNSEDRDHKVQDVDNMKNAQSNQESTVSEDTDRAKNSSSGPKHGTKPAEDVAKPSATTNSASTALSQRKVIVTMGKSSSTSLIPKPSASESCISSNAHNHDINSMQRGMSDNNLSSKKDTTLNNVVRDEERHEKPKKVVKELPKSPVGSASKAQLTKITYTSSSKKTLPDSKDSMPHSSHKTVSVRNVSANSGSGESSSSLQSEEASSVQNKPTGPILHQKGEKVNQPGSQHSVKVSGILMHPPTSLSSPAALSDEEYALLLHQQLNSSPRVPRVPRMRHAGSLPTLTSPAATSMLMKRTSSGGGKENGLTSRRRKDSSKDGSISSKEGIDEAKKRDGLTSPDYRREDTHAKREADAGSSKSVPSLKKTSPSSAAAGSNSFSSSHEAKEKKRSSSHTSQRNTSGDDTRVTGRPSHRTLPGLIAEIMSKGERMTYEELCNAVLPHWPHLRKHNGERYAYSSHSQAVLDCLRNRSEWARLVDRGPKTSTSRKRRKLDNDELEDNEDGSGRERNGKDKSIESHQEEFPKGKRKARKRRRLALQGRGIKDVRRKHRAGVVSDDDETASSSNSSDESIFSEEDDAGGATSPATKEASGSSDDRTMS